MAYSDEGVRAKLSALNETQESIVTVAQWIMFHRYLSSTNAIYCNIHCLNFYFFSHFLGLQENEQKTR